MKTILLGLMAVLAAGAVFAAPAAKTPAAKAKAPAKETPAKSGKMSLADARGKIGACIADPAKVAGIVKQLAPADQVAFLAEINEAISKMPGSVETKTALYVNIDHAAIVAADKGNKIAMIAEVFATVPPESLTVVNERFAEDLLKKDATPQNTVSNAQFERAAVSIMEKVNERCASVENAAVRSTFAALMLIHASGGTVPNLPEKLVKTLPEGSQAAARSEWIPAALGEKQTKTYEPLLGSADNAGNMPANDVIIRLVGPQLLESMLGDVVEGTPTINNSNNPEIYNRAVREDENQQQPLVDPSKIADTEPEPQPKPEPGPQPGPEPGPEPGPYQGQNP